MDDISDVTKRDELGDWKRKLVTDAAGRSALDAARHGDSLAEVKRLVQHERVTLGDRFNWEYTRSFTEASKGGQVEVVQRLIEAGVDIHARGEVLELIGSALEHAALKRRPEVVKIILAAEERQIAQDGYSTFALEQAVQDAQHEEVMRLTKAKKFIEAAQTNKNTALQNAAGLDDMEIARLLIEHGANADATPDVSHESALSCAASGGHLAMVEYLLRHGAGTTSRRCTPLRAAAAGGYLDILERLLTAGADPNADNTLGAASSGGHLTVVERLLKAGAVADNPDKWNHEFSSPLQEAAIGGHSDIVELLLQAGANVNAPALRYGQTALQAAAGSGNVKLVKRLIDAGADVAAEVGEWRHTALQAASRAGNLEIVNVLLDAGAKLETDASYSDSPSLMWAIMGNHGDVIGRLLQEMTKKKVDNTRAMQPALEACVKAGNVEILRRLISLGVSVTIDQRSRFNLLTIAAGKGYDEVVNVLLEAGVKSKNSKHYWGTALQAAVEGDHLETARILLSGGAEPSAARGHKAPALHLACMNGNEKMVRLLLEAGADVHAVSYTGKTVLDAADEGSNQVVVELLKRKQAKTRAPRKRDIALDVSTVTRADLCAICETLPATFFTKGPSWDSLKWHPSLYSLQDAARGGCPFCMFFWKQLGIKTITIPQPSKVRLHWNSLSEPKDGMSGYSKEPFPEDIRRPQRLEASFKLNIEPFKCKYAFTIRNGSADIL